ncbi:hypothetical protein HWI79_1711 [Cryptosporidium felis]|nr:hypothetical protein HWI79_1711 [Cryptosporidium felis]
MEVPSAEIPNQVELGDSANQKPNKDEGSSEPNKGERVVLPLEKFQKLVNSLALRDYQASLEQLSEYYYNGYIIEKFLEDLVLERVDYKYENKLSLDPATVHLYDISGIVILSYIIHCYICKNDAAGALQLIKGFEWACFGSKTQESETSGQNNSMAGDLVTRNFISWCKCFSIKNLLEESGEEFNSDDGMRKHVLKLMDIFYFFRIQVIFWKLTIYKAYQVPNISVFQPNNGNSSGSGKDINESIKIEDYFLFYEQSTDELYLLLDEMDYILETFGNADKRVYQNWLHKYKVVLFILIEALTLKDYYNESIQLLNESMEKHFTDDISLYSLIARVSLQYSNFPLVYSTLNTIEDNLQRPQHNTNVNIAHYRFTLGLLNMAQDDPITASLNFNTSAALYKELAISLNKEFALPCSVSFNNLSVASFYSSKLPNSISILENQIYNQHNFFSHSQQLFATNIKNLKTLYQFSSDRERLINELKNVSRNSLKYSILIN